MDPDLGPHLTGVEWPTGQCRIIDIVGLKLEYLVSLLKCKSKIFILILA